MGSIQPIGKVLPTAVWVVLMGGLIVRLVLVWLSVSELITRFNADDAYYYLTIARNLATEHGVSFDGIAPTNGFHPLYLALIVPLFWLTHDPELIAHLALTLLMVFNTLTSLPLYSVVRRIADSRAAFVAVAAWLFNPAVILIAGEGVESSLAVLLEACAIACYLRIKLDTARATDWQYTELGAFMGLAFLARSDAILLLAALAIDVSARCVRGIRLDWRKWCLGLVVAGLIIFPWLLWNLLTFGTVMQVSGAAIFYNGHFGLSGVEPSLATGLDSQMQMTRMTLVMAWQWLLIPLFAFAVWLITRRTRFRPRVVPGASIWFLYLFAFSLFVFYGGIMLHLQYWYFTPILFALTVALGICWHWVMSNMVSNRMMAQNLARLMVAAMMILSGLFGWFWQTNGLGLYIAQNDGYHVAQWLARETETSARVGAWNSGIIGYFSQRTVINLDGVVNNQLYTYVTQHHTSFGLNDIWDYVRANRIDYLTDYENLWPAQIDSQVADALQLVYDAPSTFGHYRIRVYRVLPEAQP